MKLFKFVIIFFAILIFSSKISACTIFDVKDNNGKILVGRNFDFEPEEIRVWFIPGDGKNHGIAVFGQSGPDMPYDGINDKGLFIGVAAVPAAETPLSIFKPMRKSLEMVKVVLEQAETVDEALKIFDKYSVIFGCFLGNPLIHFKIVDKNGNTAIVEYLDNGIKIIRDAEQARVITNFYISDPELGNGGNTSCERYDIAKNGLQKDDRSIKDVRDLLEKVSQPNTLYSNIYNLSDQKLYVKYGNSAEIELSLKDELYLGKHGYSLDQLSGKKVLECETINTFIFRPHFGYGSGKSGNFNHFGGRILLPAGEIRKYGLEITEFKGKDSKQFTAIGIVLEQRLFGWFNMSIGTIGYFNYGTNSDNFTGLTSNLGWEPDNHIPFRPFITYRNDLIFDKSTPSINSISTGFDFEF